MNSYRNLHVLVCPLNWGLGHATRCVPVIRELLTKGAFVTIAATGRPLHLLRQEFPGLDSLDFPGFSPTYPRSGKMAGKMLLLIPSFIYNLLYEKRELSKVIKLRKIDIVISDNRYGLYNKNVKSILIIHQIRIKTPAYLGWMEPFLLFTNRWLIRHFDQLWIPDLPGKENLSGDLAHSVKLPDNASFIGPLSRFSLNPSLLITRKRSILAILSGPEPQRSIFEHLIIAQLRDYKEDVLLIGGKSDEQLSKRMEGHVTILPFATTAEVENYLKESALVICRSGYSTIMDLATLGGKALFIPTPGQTEQEYLARYYMEKGIAFSVEQDKMNLIKDIGQALSFRGFESIDDNTFLAGYIELLLKSGA